MLLGQLLKARHALWKERRAHARLREMCENLVGDITTFFETDQVLNEIIAGTRVVNGIRELREELKVGGPR